MDRIGRFNVRHSIRKLQRTLTRPEPRRMPEPPKRETAQLLRDRFDARPAARTFDPTHAPTHVVATRSTGTHAADGTGDDHGGDVEHYHSADEAREAGKAIAERHIDRDWGFRWPPWKPQVDVDGVTADLQDLINEPSHSQAERAVVLSAALEALPEAERRQVAQQIVDGMEPEELDTIGRSGIESLMSALGDGESTQAQREVLQAELDRRGPVQERIVNGVRIVGDEVSPEAMDAAAEQIEQLMSANPELAASMEGTTVVIAPKDENGTDQEIIYEAMGIHGRETADGRPWDTVRGGASGKTFYLKENDLLGSGSQYVINHEFTHIAHHNYLDKLPADDPQLVALLDEGTEVTDVNGDGELTGADVIQIAWDQRKASGRLMDDYSGVSAAEWIGQAGSSYVGEEGKAWPKDAQWLYDNDRALYEVLQRMYGASPQPVETDSGGGGGGGRVLAA